MIATLDIGQILNWIASTLLSTDRKDLCNAYLDSSASESLSPPSEYLSSWLRSASSHHIASSNSHFPLKIAHFSKLNSLTIRCLKVQMIVLELNLIGLESSV